MPNTKASESGATRQDAAQPDDARRDRTGVRADHARASRLARPAHAPRGIRTLICLGMSLASFAAAHAAQPELRTMSAPSPSSATAQTEPASRPSPSDTLSARQQAIVPIGAFAAAGDIPGLGHALNQGLDAGLTISDAKEILVQVYAYAGFPRSLNALGELMKVVDARQKRGVNDVPGNPPGAPIPVGDALLAAGTANQTALVGQPVKGPLFDFAPAIDQYLKTHLFGDIFARDNLDWQSRELATVGMLSALQGAESQLQSHLAISMNVGLTAAQLRQLAGVLQDRVGDAPARRTREALDTQLAKKAK